jgi:hypothetical protein
LFGPPPGIEVSDNKARSTNEVDAHALIRLSFSVVQLSRKHQEAQNDLAKIFCASCASLRPDKTYRPANVDDFECYVDNSLSTNIPE